MIHIPGGMETDGARFHHTTQNSMHFKTYEFFISGIFHLISLGHSELQVTETTESKITDKGVQLYTEPVWRGGGGRHLRILPTTFNEM